jgi:uncharacterized protein
VAQGNMPATYWLALLYRTPHNGVPANHPEAIRLLKITEANGYDVGSSRDQMATLYVTSSTVRNYAEALRLYRLNNDYTNLGHMYRDGLGVPQSYVEANRLYMMAGEDELKYDAMTERGLLHLYGRGVAQNYNEASRLFGKAYSLSSKAQYWYAYMMEKGLGQAPNVAGAITGYCHSSPYEPADAALRRLGQDPKRCPKWP